MSRGNTPKVILKNKLDINKLTKGLGDILSKKYNANINITAVKKTKKRA